MRQLVAEILDKVHPGVEDAERDRIREKARAWLATHRSEREAGFIMQAWLDAGGDTRLLRKNIFRWLKEHADSPEAGPLIRAWLRAQGDWSTVQGPAGRWLRSHCQEPRADMVARLFAKQADLQAGTLRDVLTWCRTFPQHPMAPRTLNALNKHLLRPEVAPEAVLACEAVIRAVLKQPSLQPAARAVLARLFATLGDDPALRQVTKALFAKWLRHPSSYGPALLRTKGSYSGLLPLEHTSSLRYVAELIAEKAISIEQDRDALLRFFVWIRSWTPEGRNQARAFLAELAGSSASPGEHEPNKTHEQEDQGKPRPEQSQAPEHREGIDLRLGRIGGIILDR